MSAHPTSLAETRNHFRTTWVPSWYRGWAHFAFTCLWSASLIVWAFSRVRAPLPEELAVVPLSFIFANLVEYCAHRWPMHRRWPGFGLLFKRHTLLHHVFFTHQAMEAEHPNDFKMILFPPAVAVFFVGILAGPIAYFLGSAISRNTGFLFLGTSVSYFLSYEWLHWSYHQPAGHWVRRVPGVERLSRHHVVHHDPRWMTRLHFNITFPIFDRVFGTRLTDSPKEKST